MRDWRNTFIRNTREWLQRLDQQLEECGNYANCLTLSVNERTIAAVERRLTTLSELMAEQRHLERLAKPIERRISRQKKKRMK